MPPEKKDKKVKSKGEGKGDVKSAADIDDIFAGPSKSKSKDKKVKSEGKEGKESKDGKRKKEVEGKPSKKRKVDEAKKNESKKSKGKGKAKAESESEEDSFDEFEGISDDEPSGVLEVMDPSVAVRAAVEKTKAAAKAKARSGKEVQEDMAFRDSRGDANRRRTEEGFLIFKEAELKIDPEAGGTPLCPFDCECCF